MKRISKGLWLCMLALVIVLSACGQNENTNNGSNNGAAGETANNAAVHAEGGLIDLPPAEKTDVTLRLNWKFKGEFTPFFVTKEKGIFEKYGLNVDVLEGSGSVQTLQVISQNKDDFGVTSTVEPMQGIEQDMPVKMIASYMSRSPIMVLSYPDNPVRTPKDLEGKSIASSTSSTFTSIFENFMEANGADPDKVDLIKVDTGVRNTMFLTKQVDAVGIFSTNEYPMFEQELGMEMVPMYIGDFGFDIAGLTLVANNDFLAKNPNTAKRFLAAIHEGFQYTMDHPEEAASIAKELFPDAADEQLVLEQIRRTGELAVLEGKPYGWISSDNIQTTSAQLLESDLIETQLTPEEYFTNEYLPEQQH